MLTAIMPTRNRVNCVASQLRLFAAENFSHRLIVADSSDPELAVEVRAAVGACGEYRSFSADTSFYDKLSAAVAEVTTPFVLLLPDKKITCPHAVNASLEHLKAHPCQVAAMGYVLGFGIREGKIDINRVVFYTPSIEEDDPLDRHYHLMRRYQVYLWALFRREALATAIAQARSVKGSMFQEIMFMNALVVQGKIGRLPVIFALHGPEESLTPLNRAHPLYWFLDDAHSFFRHYFWYRSALATFVADRTGVTKPTADLNQVLDVIHGVWLSYNFDYGVLNYVAQQLLGVPNPPPPDPRQGIGWHPLGVEDEVVLTGKNRTYVWRNAVLNAEPRNEITITAEERENVQRELDAYFGE